MGLPKRLTDQQMKFAHELVTNEGRITATEAAVRAGYAKESARFEREFKTQSITTCC